MSVIWFGKYKGTEWANVPRDYLDWVKKNTNDKRAYQMACEILAMPAPAKFTAPTITTTSSGGTPVPRNFFEKLFWSTESFSEVKKWCRGFDKRTAPK